MRCTQFVFFPCRYHAQILSVCLLLKLIINQQQICTLYNRYLTLSVHQILRKGRWHFVKGRNLFGRHMHKSSYTEMHSLKG